jgi:pimeloyl-ACP methyl ester carboxylesterase
MPADASPASEAEFFRCFLDALGTGKAGVIAASAGSSPALQLALRHPDLVSSLVILVPAIGGIGPADSVAMVPAFIMKVILGFDFPYWAAMKIWPGIGRKIVAVPDSLVPDLAEQDRADLDTAVSLIMPVSWRRRGIAYDAHNQMTEPPYPLEKITVPTLFVSARDDMYRTLPNAREATRRIPGAWLIELDRGGHLLLGQGPVMWAAIGEFLAK